MHSLKQPICGDPGQIVFPQQARRHCAVIVSVSQDSCAHLIFRSLKPELWVNRGELGTQPARGTSGKLSALDHDSMPGGAACTRDRLGPDVVLHLSCVRSHLMTVTFYREGGYSYISSQNWIHHAFWEKAPCWTPQQTPQTCFRPAGGIGHTHKHIDARQSHRVTENNEEHETLKNNELEIPVRMIQYMEVMGIIGNYVILSHYINIIY